MFSIESYAEFNKRSVLEHDMRGFTADDFIGKEIQLHWTGIITCRTCSKKTKKSFGEGFIVIIHINIQ